ncbi:flagellar basal body-associated FliL family protein [Blastococcus sp. CT_GayMR19]|uniref:flagellar basal body-associated FliL family protein n=1 Tax=Blastococcus sp. CT_GayMR19 TaxID=2559608 RepID=UPI0010745E92|nr:flagellar basal body-associated FliL family protein [Blastococcus sp. CT_GayMR19]TFV78546.1 flagellar basal body-associated FliL family protein [Blastococcus sp. CT_GayMR19]
MSTKEKAPETDEAPVKGGKKKLILIVLVVLLAAAGAAYFFLFTGSAEAEEPVAGEVLSLEPVAVNLAGGGYLKVGLALQLVASEEGGHGAATGPSGAKATDLVISTFSQAQPADVTGARDALKEALEEKIIEAYHGEVMGIYYTEYVTQ